MEALLELKNIRKSFGLNNIHKGVTFSLNPHESIGLLGGSGTGKSVLLRSIIGLEYIDDGEILFKKKRIDSLSENELLMFRTKISYSFQNGALFDSINVFENLAYPLKEHTDLNETQISEKVSSILNLVKMPGTEKLMPSDLSGGMQKRIGMARSMILDPDIVLFDEPTAGLDPQNTQNVVDIMLASKKRGISSIFVTHDIPAALQVCDRILILKNGIIEYEGTPEEMKSSKNDLVKEFLQSSKGQLV